MSALDPSRPSQPTVSQAYTTPGNAASNDPVEKSQTAANAQNDSVPVDQRVPQKQTSGEGTASSLGRGIHGAPAGEESKGLTEEDVGRHNELDGAQMAAPGEGRVADVVAGRGGVNLGGGGSEPDMASDLDRKKAEQQGARDAIDQQKGANSRVGGALGQTGGPANPVDNPNQGGNYPNTGT
ncbi:hypothetical protein K458DRAFT_341351 [Lentithecium fluviatile CBS 122367]|uniref:Uncharacterized protein n=1 Tax=Lentithecium fluviatile CBS 122367 TaxID=1168545 RepID=A0A6G1IXN0_9PLEO|nr:hypothetical protein K458DRAFT_341351 [Lentithecium fluviatile CBS 122367]